MVSFVNIGCMTQPYILAERKDMSDGSLSSSNSLILIKSI